ncbi:LytTR family DNA-binding domain-containing protein [Nitrospirillum sp. BR 11164]|uniref:LytR/AlgR family response regulator transcription factor n=1 Tax=Nitrospirillum sp. BR 11164 TaxID=3104324 RepID=UPI002B002C2B|nr:LytTR family DNA-binding domain-containing protein [Nitrospirillum sp. BR 11164]MEA1650810.1 LytTR family DNA-binding domain-containing protein [Nitrospirillum sp. BR 11164]
MRQAADRFSAFWSTPNLKAWALVWLGFAFVPTTINAFALLTEYERTNQDIPAWEPFLREYSSGVALLLVLPLVRWSINHMPGWSEAPLRCVAQFLGTALAFSTLHLAAMTVLRMAAYGALGQSYAVDDLRDDLPYEFRKDLLTYLLIVLVVVGVRHLIRLSRSLALVEAAANAAARATEGQGPPETAAAEPARLDLARIELKVGSRRVYLAPADILLVRSAGNYIEVVTAEAVHLVRRTLADFQAELPPPDFARVHRSHLVNRGAIVRIDNRPSGDMDLTLSNGATIPASRRYKSELF